MYFYLKGGTILCMNNKTKRVKKLKDTDVVFQKSLKGSREKKEKKHVGKRKIIIASIASVLVLSTVLGCCLHFFVFNKKIDYFDYFNNFSITNVKKAECTLTLSEGVKVKSYDAADDLFITQKDYAAAVGTGKVTLYGLASTDREYCLPTYNGILHTNGDYAIVTLASDNTQQELRVGVIRFRGEGITTPIYMTDFNLVYNENNRQPKFVGNYVCFYGTKDEYDSNLSYVTFYDYKTQNTLLEAFKLRYAYSQEEEDYYDYLAHDDYVVAYTGRYAHFFNVKADFMHDGYLENSTSANYMPFPDFEDAFADYTEDMYIYYLGNGWYARTAALKKSSPFQGFNVCYYESTSLVYARSKTDFYNVKTGITSEINSIFYIEGVANIYEADLYAEYSNYLTNSAAYDDDYNLLYDLPYANSAAMIKDGYSIIYFKYLPRIAEYTPEDTQYTSYISSTTFCIMDYNMNVIFTNTAILPTMFIDGVGVQTASPIFTDHIGDNLYFNKSMQTTVLDKFEQGQVTYITHYGDPNSVIALQNKRVDSDNVSQLYGATRPDGQRILDYEYTYITPYNGDYCYAATTQDKYVIYRVDKNGSKEEIKEIIKLYQTTYSYKDGEKFGLKNYNGEVLIKPEATYIDVIDCVMKDGKIITSYCVAIIGGQTLIYKLV